MAVPDLTILNSARARPGQV